MKGTKIFLKKKSKKSEKRSGTNIKIFLKMKKKKSISITGIEIKKFLKKESKKKCYFEKMDAILCQI